MANLACSMSGVYTTYISTLSCGHLLFNHMTTVRWVVRLILTVPDSLYINLSTTSSMGWQEKSPSWSSRLGPPQPACIRLGQCHSMLIKGIAGPNISTHSPNPPCTKQDEEIKSSKFSPTRWFKPWPLNIPDRRRSPTLKSVSVTIPNKAPAELPRHRIFQFAKHRYFDSFGSVSNFLLFLCF